MVEGDDRDSAGTTGFVGCAGVGTVAVRRRRMKRRKKVVVIEALIVVVLLSLELILDSVKINVFKVSEEYKLRK